MIHFNSPSFVFQNYRLVQVRDCPQLCLKMKRIKKGELSKKGKGDKDEDDGSSEMGVEDDKGLKNIVVEREHADGDEDGDDKRHADGALPAQSITMQGPESQGMSGNDNNQNNMIGMLAGQMPGLQGFLSQAQGAQQVATPANLQALLGQAQGLPGINSQVAGMPGLGGNQGIQGRLPAGPQNFAGQASAFHNVQGPQSGLFGMQLPNNNGGNQTDQGKDISGQMDQNAPGPSGMIPPLPGNMPSAAPGLSAVDNATLMKLQEALSAASGGSNMLQQLQQSQQQQNQQLQQQQSQQDDAVKQQQAQNAFLSQALNPPGGTGNFGFLSSQFGGQNAALLAAQLQAATQPSNMSSQQGGNHIDGNSSSNQDPAAILAAQLQAAANGTNNTQGGQDNNSNNAALLAAHLQTQQQQSQQQQQQQPKHSQQQQDISSKQNADGGSDEDDDNDDDDDVGDESDEASV